jgi:hypothetical protein
MYLDEIAATIRAHIPEGRLPEGDADELLRFYAVLLRAKGADVTQSDVHDAWSVWMAQRQSDHMSLVPYTDLPENIRDEDRIFTTAIRRVAEELRQSGPSRPHFSEVLFPFGPPTSNPATQQTFDLYKIMVASSEALVSRRQAVNTFFLTMNGALLTASGLIVQSSGGQRLGGLGIAVLSLAGALLCLAWRSLITSFGQLNRGKFQVINTIERYFTAAIYAAEWEALGRGEDPKTYRSFTSREIWVPNALLVIHLLVAVGALMVAAGLLYLNNGTPAGWWI